MSNPRIPFELQSARKRLAPPGGKPIIVQIVVNVEHWRFDKPMPRQALTPTAGVQPRPDVPNWSWAEYGMRCGVPRLIELFKALEIPASAAINASVIDSYPALAEAILAAGWEFVGHCWFQQTLQQAENEAEVIGACVDRLQRFTGRPTRGWLGAGLHETDHTPEHLTDAGIEYVLDWVLDDLPCWMQMSRGRLLSVPYSVELNDVVIYSIEKHPGIELVNRVADTLATFDKEISANPRVITIPLHPYAIGAPHRMPHLERTLRLLRERDDTVFMTGGDITSWFVAADGQAGSSASTASRTT